MPDHSLSPPDRAHRERRALNGLRKPNLFLIGAMKSGTTYLNKLLGAHSAIFMCSPEEPSYFVDPGQLRRLWPDAWDYGFWRSEDRYLGLFDGHADAAFLGEASTNYTKRPLVTGVPERIRAFNPEARFIYLLRDPVERTISHYWHMVRYHAERRMPLEAFKEEPQYVDVSNYEMQLQPYLTLFGADRVAVLTFEQLTRAPTETMRSLYAWLGVDIARADVSDFGRPENVTPASLNMAAWRGIPQRLRQSRPMRYLVPRLPRGLREKAVRLTTRPVGRQFADTTEAIEFLRPIQRRQTERLVRLLGRAFPEWSTLYDKEIV
jgi:Sulfotransferase family